jgi:hypothetical protein
MKAVRGRYESATLCTVSYQEPVGFPQVPCTPYYPPNITGVIQPACTDSPCLSDREKAVIYTRSTVQGGVRLCTVPRVATNVTTCT